MKRVSGLSYLSMLPIKAVRRTPVWAWILAFALGMVAVGAVVNAGINLLWGCG